MNRHLDKKFNIDIGDLCTECGDDTSYGSGKWANRIASTAGGQIQVNHTDIAYVEVDGWMCKACLGDDEGCFDRNFFGTKFSMSEVNDRKK